MIILLNQLKICHFKGIKSLEVSFGEITNIGGANATGKSTVMDAFLWLLFGKDSSGRKEFEVKPISLNGNGGPKTVEVEAILMVDGRAVSLKRVYREKWVKRRGSADVVMDGHESTFFYNEVPVTLKEYSEKVAQICPEETFKVITNPQVFPSLNWKVQRDILFEIAGNLSDDQIANGNKAFEQLVRSLNGMDMDEMKKKIANDKRRIKEELSLIPSRIDEVNRNMPAEEDWNDLSLKIHTAQKHLNIIDEAITDQSKAYELAYEQKASLQKRIFEAKGKLNYLVSRHEAQVKSKSFEQQEKRLALERNLQHLKQDVKDHEESIAELENKLEVVSQKMSQLRQRYYDVQQSSLDFNPKDAVCPTCKKPVDDYEKKQSLMQKDFNINKSQKLESIQSEGKTLKQEKLRIEQKVSLHQNELKQVKRGMHELLEALERYPMNKEAEINKEDIPGYIQAKAYVDKLQQEYDEPIDCPKLDELKQQKTLLRQRIEEHQAILSLRDHIQKSQARIKELEHQQQVLAQEVARLEQIEFNILDFEKAKVNAIEKRINSMFQITRWKLFDQQINGGEVPVCTAMYKKVPYADLNSAAKANVGLDIINTLSKHYQVTAPIFFDNREGVNELIDTPSQLINLIVTKDPELIIETL